MVSQAARPDPHQKHVHYTPLSVSDT